MLVTRGCAEMTRLAVALGADPLTLAGNLNLICNCFIELFFFKKIHLFRIEWHW